MDPISEPIEPADISLDQQKIGPRSRVTFHFSLATTDGTEIASTFGDSPTTVTLGDGSLNEGLEHALYGLTSGEEQTLTLTPGQAFGPRDEGKTRRLPRSDFPAEMELAEGLVIAFETLGGEEVAGIVLALDEEEVEIDFNHPLAGQEVVFHVRILDVEPPHEDAAGE